MIEFGVHFLSILAAVRDPSWDHVRRVFRLKRGRAVRPTLCFVRCKLFFVFDRHLDSDGGGGTPSDRLHFGRFFGPFWDDYFLILS